MIELDKRFSIGIGVAVRDNKTEYGDIYSSLDDLRKDHPNEGWVFGYFIYDNLSESEMEDTQPFYLDIDDAYFDYQMAKMSLL